VVRILSERRAEAATRLTRVPKKALMVVKAGKIMAFVPPKMFQSKVGRGLNPIPEMDPKTAITPIEVGLILRRERRRGQRRDATREVGRRRAHQSIQLKYERAWKSSPGSQK